MPDLNIESFSLSGLTENEDLEFYSSWKKIFEQFLKEQSAINDESSDHYSEKENVSDNFIVDKRFEITENISREEISNKLNQTLNFEERGKNNENQINTHILMKKFSKEREEIGNKLTKHSKWLSNLKTQVLFTANSLLIFF